MALKKRTKSRRIRLEKTLFLLPNMVTLASLVCAFYAMVIATSAQQQDAYFRAATFIILAMFCDTLDGRVARMTKTQSAFGLQLDSLADVVSFGVAPALLMYNYQLVRLGSLGMLVCCAYLACGAVRLARFNVISTDPSGAPAKPGKYIVGLPIPGAAAVLVAVVVAGAAAGGLPSDGSAAHAVAGIMAFVSFLMVSSLNFRSFKELKLNVRSVSVFAALVMAASWVAVTSKPSFVLLFVLGLYVALAVAEWLWALPRRIRAWRSGSQVVLER